MTSFWGELKRRNVVRVAIAYAVVSWLLLQMADVVLDNIEAPSWVFQAILLLLIIGFPLALIFAWAFELTPEGIKKEKDVDRSESVTHLTGRKLDYLIIGVLVLALGYFAYDKFALNPDRHAAEIEAAVQVAREEVASAVAPQVSAKSIAVLAFADLSPEGDQEYFSDGVSEEILNLLAQVPELRVISRSSAFSFKGQNVDIPTMAARLNVAHVLEGSVRKSGNQLRITAQLIEVATDTHLWSQTYDKEFENVFAIQDEIAAAVVDALKITLLGEEPKATETNPDAYALYLRGRYVMYDFTAENYDQAETLLKQALAIDPGFAPAWTELSHVYRRRATIFFVRTIDEGYELARQATQRALAIDPQYGPAYAALAEIEMSYDWDFTAAYQHLRQAQALHPGDSAIRRFAARLETVLGRVDEAIDLYRQGNALDPLSGNYGLGLTYYYAHRLEEAADSFRTLESLTPDVPGAHYSIVFVLLAQGDAPAALVEIKQHTDDWRRLHGLAIVQHALGNAEASDAALHELIEEWAEATAYKVAMVYAYRGEIDLAFDWLNQAYDNRESGVTQLLLDPLFANLHDDARWEPFLDKMGLPH